MPCKTFCWKMKENKKRFCLHVRVHHEDYNGRDVNFDFDEEKNRIKVKLGNSSIKSRIPVPEKWSLKDIGTSLSLEVKHPSLSKFRLKIKKSHEGSD